MVIKHFFVALAVVAAVNGALGDVGKIDYGLFNSEESTSAPATSTPPEINKSVSRFDSGKECGVNGKCVTFQLCSKNGEIIDDGWLLINERLDIDEPPCPTLEVCCRRKDLRVAPSNLQCKNYGTAKNCGYRNAVGIGAPVKSAVRTNLKYSQYGEFPWSMAVMDNRGITPTIHCGGTLIHPKVVISVAHKLADIPHNKITVRGGEFNTKTTEEICPHVDLRVEQVINHEKFVRQNLHNDIAMIVLTQPFELSPTINTICLPPAGMSFDEEICYVSGWGKTNFTEKEKHQVYPKIVELEVVPNDECQDKLRKSRLGVDFILHKNFMCAGGDPGVDACTGDGGSALFCEIRNKRGHYYFAGVVAGGIGCYDVYPGFYSSIPKHRQWIDEKMEELGLQ